MNTQYLSHEDKLAEQVSAYAQTKRGINRYLSYRDIPALIQEYVQGDITLDYGAGTGISTEFLYEQGLKVTGVDISEEMYIQAKDRCPYASFHLIQNGITPFPSETYDFVFSSFVLLEIGSEKDILAYLAEAKRVMKSEGVFIAVTGSQDMYSKNWLLSRTDYPENKNLKSGDKAKIFLRDPPIEFTDFYWTESDYKDFFKKVGFHLMKVHHPLGKKDEPYPWKEELGCSPFVIFVAKKA